MTKPTPPDNDDSSSDDETVETPPTKHESEAVDADAGVVDEVVDGIGDPADDDGVDADADASPAEHKSSGRQKGALALIIVGAFLLLVAIFSVWVHEQVLDTDQWVKTSSEIIQSPEVQTATAAYVGDEISSAPGVTDALESVLPPRLAPVAGAATGFLGEAAEKATLRALEAGKFQEVWANANRLAHEQFLRVVEGNTIREQQVVLDLRPMLGRAAARIGLAPETVAGLSSEGGLIRILTVEQVENLRTSLKLLRDIALASTILGLGFLIAGVAIATERRKALVVAGSSLILVGMLVLILRRIGGAALIDAVVPDGTTEAAASQTWLIASSFLAHIARGITMLGIVTLLGAWLAGPGKYATKLRNFIAPGLLNFRWAAYAVVSAIVLLIVLNGLLPWAWSPIALLVYLAGGIIFVEILRNEVKPATAE